MKQLNDMKSRLTTLNEQVYRTEQKLKKSERRLRELEKRIEEREVLLKNRLRFLYQRGEMFYLETLLDSDSFGDFLTRLDLSGKLIRADRKLLDSHKGIKSGWKRKRLRSNGIGGTEAAGGGSRAAT